MARLCAIGFAVAPLGILFASDGKEVFWTILIAVALFKAGRAGFALRGEFSADRASELLAWLVIAVLFGVAYATAHRLAPALVHTLRPASGEFALDELALDLLAGEVVDPGRLALLGGPPPEASLLHEWLVYGLSRAEAEGCAPELARSIKDRARSSARADGSGGSTGFYRDLAALARTVAAAPRRPCAEAIRACLVPLLAPEVRGTLRLDPLRDGSVLVSGETTPLTHGSMPGRFEGRLARSALVPGSVLEEAPVRDVRGSLLPGIVPDGSDILLLLGPAGPQQLVVSRAGIPFLRARVRWLR
jgi:hypothetical protein